jgi:hypothetical protein
MTNGQRDTRRQFIQAGSFATLGAAFGLTGSNIRTVQAAENGEVASATPFLNARELGARGDGETDDTAALQAAIAQAHQQRIGTLFLPAGTYRISDALRLPSNLTLLGAGPGLTVLQAVPETLFPMFKPDPRTADVRQRRTMVTTTSAGTVREEIVSRSGLAHLTVDWNQCPTDGYGSSCVLFDSADHCRLDQVRFVNALPSDHPRTLEEMRGSGFRSECVMYCNARHGLMDGCELVDSGYRPLSVAYGSQDITFQNGRIVASNPVWRHAFAEVHGDGIPRDEHYVRSQVKFLNSTFVLEGGTAQDGICSHTGTVVIENCDFHILGGTEHFRYVVKPFDRSHRCQCLNNRFYCHGEYANTFSIIGSIGRPTNEEMLFVGNIVNITLSSDAGDRIDSSGLIDFSIGEARCRIQDNQLKIHLETPRGLAAIKLRNTRNFTVANNLIEFTGAAGEAGPAGIDVADAASGTVLGNVVTGEFAQALRLADDLPGVIVTANSPD